MRTEPPRGPSFKGPEVLRRSRAETPSLPGCPVTHPVPHARRGQECDSHDQQSRAESVVGRTGTGVSGTRWASGDAAHSKDCDEDSGREEYRRTWWPTRWTAYPTQGHQHTPGAPGARHRGDRRREGPQQLLQARDSHEVGWPGHPRRRGCTTQTPTCTQAHPLPASARPEARAPR